MIRLLHVFKQFRPGMYALEDVNLRLDKGEFAFLTGPSGAGKTTLLRLLLREEKPTRGQILIQGNSIANLPPGKIPYLRRKIGVVFQDFKLLHRKTVFENIAFALEIVGIVGQAQRTRTREVINDLGLYNQRNAYPEELPGGEKQRTAIADTSSMK